MHLKNLNITKLIFRILTLSVFSFAMQFSFGANDNSTKNNILNQTGFDNIKNQDLNSADFYFNRANSKESNHNNSDERDIELNELDEDNFDDDSITTIVVTLDVHSYVTSSQAVSEQKLIYTEINSVTVPIYLVNCSLKIPFLN